MDFINPSKVIINIHNNIGYNLYFPFLNQFEEKRANYKNEPLWNQQYNILNYILYLGM